jgi:hypothetical protein
MISCCGAGTSMYVGEVISDWAMSGDAIGP